MRRFLHLVALLLAACALALLAGCGDSDDGDSSASAGKPATTQEETTPTEPAPDANGCTPVADAPPAKDVQLSKPTTTLDPAKTWTATVSTTCGEFTIQLDVKRAPKTSASFASLAQKHFFDKTTFHRIVPGFVIQGGDPLGNGTGGPGYQVVEAPPKNLKYTHGIVAMAKAGNEPPGASGSQFFVVTAPTDSGLPAEYALLGKVTKGLDVVDAIGSVELDPASPGDGPPAEPIVIMSVKVTGS